MAKQMLDFLNNSPMAPEVSECKDSYFLYHFEAARQLIVRRHLSQFGFENNARLEILDFGYLSGITQEFTHRAFPNAKFRVFDRPDGTIFSNPKYLEAIEKRGYLSLERGDLIQLESIPGQYDIIFLGEIIEHLDPTTTASVLKKLRTCAKSKCCLIITTPNGAGLYNCWMTLTGKDVIQAPPLPNPIHGLPHIHLWSAPVLKQTAEAFGWRERETTFYHGREGEHFEKLRKRWISLRSQVLMRGIEFLSNRYPKVRGCFVSSFE